LPVVRQTTSAVIFEHPSTYPSGDVHHAPVAVPPRLLIENRAADDQFVGAGALQQICQLLTDGLFIANQGAGQG